MQAGVRIQESGFGIQEAGGRRVGNGIPNFKFRISLFDFQLSQESEKPYAMGSPPC
jgi:hypothetical protein